MKHIKYARTFEVSQELPKKLSGLQELVYNLRWTWDHETKLMFKSINKVLWTESNHNPIALINNLTSKDLMSLQADRGFMQQLKSAHKNLQKYMRAKSWFENQFPEANSNEKIAYFCAEFGINECLPIYSGGLGILAGDHLKAASDLGIPLVGVGLLYSRGYFRQFISPDGWQQEKYPQYNYHEMPIEIVKSENGQPVQIHVDFPDRRVFCRIWKAQVGRISLYLLDSNVLENDHYHKSITDTLYGGNEDMRIRQEVILGIGGMKALKALNITPAVCHMNEGHSAFLTLERMRQLMELNGLSHHEARELVSAGNVFTTHTPVPAGFDLFHNELISKYLIKVLNKLHMPFDEFLDQGRFNEYESDGLFNMAIYAMSNTNSINGVSKLHAKVSQDMFHQKWPNYSIEQVPIKPVTNGVHVETWVSNRMSKLFDRYMGDSWRDPSTDSSIWNAIYDIPDAEIWNIRENQRADLIRFCRNRAAKQQFHKPKAGAILDPRVLTIGFARRFATYKRATLIFSDIDRLRSILHHSEKPVQIIFAGKSHPRDDGGKKYIQEIVKQIQNDDGPQRIFFLEDYDMNIASKLVQGVDIWLNNPRRPLEASGTSGMKVLCNGGLNCSILDGWWAEGYQPGAGWAIGDEEEYSDPGYQDWLDSLSLYNLMESEITPMFYHRNTHGIPEQWLKMVKKSMAILTPAFSTGRMVKDYTNEHYMPANNAYQYLNKEDRKHFYQFKDWRDKLYQEWQHVVIRSVEDQSGNRVKKTDGFNVNAEVALGSLNHEDVCVQAVIGKVGVNGELNDTHAIDLSFESSTDGVFRYTGFIECNASGSWGYVLRVLPKHSVMNSEIHLPLAAWEQDAFFGSNIEHGLSSEMKLVS